MTSLGTASPLEATRRRRLIEATIETLAEIGFKAASLNEIARRADVSTGLFAHYFGDKEGLLEATLRSMAARLARQTALRLRSAATRRDRLLAVGEAALADQEFDRRTSTVWLAFWGQMTHSERYRRIQRVYQRRMASNLRHALRGLVPANRVEPCAVVIAATIDGLWLRSHASAPLPRGEPSDAAGVRALLQSSIDALLASASPGGSRDGSAPPTAGWAEAPTSRGDGRARAAATTRQGLAAWEDLPAPDRARTLRRCADALRAEGPALARSESRETGRPLRATAGLDLEEAIARIDAAADLAAGLRAVRVELEGGRIGESRCAPGGLSTAAVHWSRPSLDLGAGLGALARGDALLVCADPHAIPTTRRIASLFTRAGLPEGVLTLVEGQTGVPRHDVGQCESGHGPAFEGEEGEAAPFGRARPKGATVVLPGADLERAAQAILLGCRAWTGSTFSSQNRIHVHQAVRRPFAECLEAAAAGLRVGDPLADGTEIGPLLSRAQGEWVSALLEADLRAGARLVAGSGSLSPGAPADPVWLAPIVVDGCGPGSALVRADTFAPVVALLPFAEDGELAALGRRAPGSAVGVFTGDLDRARRAVAAFDRPLSFIEDDGLSAAPPFAADDPSLGPSQGSWAPLRWMVIGPRAMRGGRVGGPISDDLGSA